jgi:hypothetical protein
MVAYSRNIPAQLALIGSGIDPSRCVLAGGKIKIEGTPFLFVDEILSPDLRQTITGRPGSDARE